MIRGRFGEKGCICIIKKGTDFFGASYINIFECYILKVTGTW